jgi:small GTP-binding protein
MSGPQQTKEEILSFKILLLGDSTVGKTAFILRFCEDKFEEDSLTTIGLDQKNKFVKRGDKRLELHIWDTAGQERFRSIAKNCYKGADGIILMYDISKYETFKHIKTWINNIKESIDIDKIALIVVGNKCDLPDSEKNVDQDSKQNFENTSKMKIIEASAKDNINVNESFISLIDKMLELGLGKKKGSDDDNDNDEVNNAQQLKRNKTNDKKKKDNCCGGSRKK